MDESMFLCLGCPQPDHWGYHPKILGGLLISQGSKTNKLQVDPKYWPLSLGTLQSEPLWNFPMPKELGRDQESVL